MKEIGDKKLITTWASLGDRVDPPGSQKATGWLFGQQPPLEWFNFLLAENQQKLNYILREGVPEWDEETPYVLGSFVKHNGVFWKSTNSNTNSEPDFSNADWDDFLNGMKIWNDSETYNVDQLLIHNQSLWVAQASNSNSEPSLTNSDWERFPSFSLNKWNNSIVYSSNQFVFHSEAIWRCVSGNSNSEPSLDNSDWQRYPIFTLNEWDNQREYNANDLVFWEGFLYKSITTNTNLEPPLHENDWVFYPDFSLSVWDSIQVYSPGDLVYFQGNLWKAEVLNAFSTPALDNANWSRYPRFSLNKWESNLQYQTDDLVFYEGFIYVSLTSNFNSQPDSNPTDWIFAEGGESEATPSVVARRDAESQSKFATPTHQEHVLRPADRYQPTVLTGSDFTTAGPTAIGRFILTPAMGQYIKIDFGGSTLNRRLVGFGNSCPVGWTVTVEVVRREPATGSSITNSRGDASLTFEHLSTELAAQGKLNNRLFRRLNGSSYAYDYTAYPNASDKKNRALCLNEILTYRYLGSDQWLLIDLPQPVYIRHGTNPNSNGFVSAHLFPDGVVKYVNHRFAFSQIVYFHGSGSDGLILADFGTSSWGAQGHIATTWAVTGTNNAWNSSSGSRSESVIKEVGTSNSSSSQVWIMHQSTPIFGETTVMTLSANTLWKPADGS